MLRELELRLDINSLCMSLCSSRVVTRNCLFVKQVAQELCGLW
jgi:hypothetical protein